MALSSALIHGFSASVLAKKYDGAVNTPEFHKELWELFSSKNKCVAAAAPRGHGKSTAITFAYTLANILFRERRFVILVSDTEAQAINFIADIKTELKENEDLIALFQIKKLLKDSETSVIGQFEDGQVFRIDAKGQGFKRGMKWDNKRPDLIICDDLENEEVVYNKERREKFKRWFYGTVIPSLSKDGILRVVGTVLHLDSLLNTLMPDERLPSTIVTPLRTYNNTTRGQWHSVRYKAHNEDFSAILWQTRWPKEELIRTREDYLSRGLSDVYSQEYLNYPIDESVAFFRREDFFSISENHLDAIREERTNVNYYVGCDLAVSTVARSDYTVFVVVGVDDQGMMNVVDVRRGRWDSLQIIDEFFVIQTRYKPEWFAMERGTIEKSIGPVIRAEMLARRNFIKFELSTANKDKQTRARGIQARFRAGGIKFDKTASWYPDLEDEFIRFPKTRYDDTVDALAWLGLTYDSVQQASTAEEDEEEDYQESLKGQEAGRSITTGY